VTTAINWGLLGNHSLIWALMTLPRGVKIVAEFYKGISLIAPTAAQQLEG